MSSVPVAPDAPALADLDVELPGSLWDSEAAAWAASLAVHLLVLVLLTVASLALPRTDGPIDLALQPLDADEPDALTHEFVSSDMIQDGIGALALGDEGSALASAPDFSEQSMVIQETDLLDLPAERIAVELEMETSRGPEFSDSVPVQGVGSVGTTGAAGAIDRLTHEILASLEQRPTMVVWLFDQSGSLKAERANVTKRFRRIYEELGVIEAADNPAFRKHEDKPLLTAVVGFGSEPRMFLDKPTDRIEDIEAAVKSIEDDQSGRENVFRAIGMVAEKFRTYRTASNGKRHVMIVVFTDEAGDDAASLDATVDVCRKYAMPVYVVGRPAPFGRQTAYVKYVDPDPRFDQRPQWVPVTLGPESLMPELLKLRSAERGDEEELLESGFGPYALTRLCFETGGLYFAAHPNRVLGRKVSGAETDNLSAHFSAFFSEDAMRRYQPDYVPAHEYMRLLQTNRARRALITAAEMTWTSPLENVRLRFPKRDEAELAQSLSLAQRSAAILQPKINAICDVLLDGEEDRAAIKEPRWQAGFDLAIGRSLAVKVRTDGYNVMLAEAKQGKPFKDVKNNTWILRPAEYFAVSGLERAAAKARGYLEGVVRDHPETPWAMLAERELKTPLGWRWDEGFTPIPPREEGNGRPRRPEPPAPQGPPRRNPPPL